MLVNPDLYSEVFESIKSDLYESTTKKVCVIVSTSCVDSICAAKILHTILDHDNVHFATKPVASYEELQDTAAKYTSEEEDFQTLVLINCGATEDLYELLDLRPAVRVVVIDSHRPIHHSLNSRNTQVAVLVDPEDGTLEGLPEAEDTSDAEEEEDFPGTTGQESNQENIPDNRNPDGSPAAKRTKREQQRQQRRELRRRRKEYYERGTFWGKPAAFTLWELTHQLQLENSNQLWLAMLGVTDHLVHERLSTDQYSHWGILLEQKVADCGMLAREEMTEVQQPGEEEGERVTTTVTKAQYGKIRLIQDHFLVLLRHWSLFEALQFSAYVAVRLQTWHDRGRRTLQHLLVTMGYPARQYQKKYGAMQAEFQRMLADRLEEHAPHYRLTNLQYRSFEIQHSYDRQTATDTVHAVAALLETPPQGHEDTPVERFWQAFKALAVDERVKLFAHGLDQSKQVQRAVVMDGGLILARSPGYMNTKHYHLWNLSAQEVNNKAILSRPLTLAKLGHFLMEARYHQTGKRKSVVLVAPADGQRQCLVMGLVGGSTLATQQGNTFGIAFRRIADDLGCAFKHHFFDTAILELGIHDVPRFLNSLKTAFHS